MELHLRVIGWIMIALAFVHVGFPRYFQWKKELEGLQLINKQVMEVHTFFVAFVVFLMGALNVVVTPEEVTSSLGEKLWLGMTLFWGTRLAIQFFWYSPKLWKGRVFETTVHGVFCLLWSYFTAVFLMLYLGVKL